MTAAPDETIVAVATPPGTGAVSIVRISGPAVNRLAKRFVRTKSPLRPRIATRATLLDEDGEPLDHGLALLFPRPHSYTGEDLLELQTHGSPVVVREVVRALLGGGARLAGPGEFTRRAFSTASWACTKRRRSPTSSKPRPGARRARRWQISRAASAARFGKFAPA